MSKDSIVLLGCGDVGAMHAPTSQFSTLVRETLASGDIRFANLELVYSDKGSPQVHSNSRARVKPELASIITECQFDVVSIASNLALCWGPEALLDSTKLIGSKGVLATGAGKNLEEACKPAIIEREGIRVAFLAYCSVVPEGFAAGPHKPGVAPLRARTYYDGFDWQPGMPPRVVTVPYEEDMRAMVGHIEAAKKDAHCVVVSFHWGLHFLPRLIADYQRIAAQAAFDAGADLILGHHAHLPKGVEIFDGKACFYSLSNFIMTDEEPQTPEKNAAYNRLWGQFGGKAEDDPAYSHFPPGADGKRSLIAKFVLSKKGVERISFLPVLIDKQLRPEVLRNGDPRFDDMVRYMDWSSEGMNHRFKIEGDEVVVEG